MFDSVVIETTLFEEVFEGLAIDNTSQNHVIFKISL